MDYDIDETQYSNIMRIINKYHNMPVGNINKSDLSEANIMALLFSSSFSTENNTMISELLKYTKTNVYQDINEKAKFYTINMTILNDISSENLIDLDISYLNTQKIIKYYFLIDFLSEIYSYILKNNSNVNNITIRSRYYIKDNIWQLYNKKDYFSFNISFIHSDINGIKNFKVESSDIIPLYIIEEMCTTFLNDILRHLNYLNKIDIYSNNEVYLNNIVYFYKMCRLKLVYYTLLSGLKTNENIQDFINKKMFFCIFNLKKKIALSNINNKSFSLTNKIISSKLKLNEINNEISKDTYKIKKNKFKSKSIKTNFLNEFFYSFLFIIVLFVAFVVVTKVTGTFSNVELNVGFLIILLSGLIYSITYYIIKNNFNQYIENFETNEIYLYPTVPATKNFFYDNNEEIYIKVKVSSINANSNDGWKVLDRNPNTYWESKENTYRKPTSLYKRTVCTLSRYYYYSYGHWHYDYHPYYGWRYWWHGYVTYYSEPIKTCTTSIVTESENEGALIAANTPYYPYYWPWWNYGYYWPYYYYYWYPYYPSWYYWPYYYPYYYYPYYWPYYYYSYYTISYEKLNNKSDLQYSYAINKPEYILFDMGKPIILSYYKIRYVDKDSAPKSFRLIGTNDEKMMDTTEIYGLYHDTVDEVELTVQDIIEDNTILRTNINKGQYAIHSYDHHPVNESINDLDYYYMVIDKCGRNYIDVLDDIEVDLLVVGGGGSGGTRNGGGGGGGAVIEKKNLKLIKGKYEAHIGKGGEALESGGPSKPGKNGESTYVVNITGTDKDNGPELICIAQGGGGGGGGMKNAVGIEGIVAGCNGGSASQYHVIDYPINFPKEVNTTSNYPDGVFGNIGGYGYYGRINRFASPGAGGGGGGAGSEGKKSSVNTTGSDTQIYAGYGGDGYKTMIKGFEEYYGGGGAGGTTSMIEALNYGKGGKGGGGDGLTSHIDYLHNIIDCHYCTFKYDYPIQSCYKKYDAPADLQDYKTQDYSLNISTDIQHHWYLKFTENYYIYYDSLDENKKIYSTKFEGDSLPISLTNKTFTKEEDYKPEDFKVFLFQKKVNRKEVLFYTFKNIVTNFKEVNSYMNKIYDLAVKDNKFKKLCEVSKANKNETCWAISMMEEIYKLKNKLMYESKLTVKGPQFYNSLICNGVDGTGGGGGGGATYRDSTNFDEDGEDHFHITGSGAGGCGVVIIRWKKILNIKYTKQCPYRYYGLVIDKLLGLGKSVKISEIYFYKQIPAPKGKINTIVQFYDNLLQPQIEIVGEAKEKLEKIDEQLKEKQRIESENNAEIQRLKDILKNFNNQNNMSNIQKMIIDETTSNVDLIKTYLEKIDNLQNKIDESGTNITLFEQQKQKQILAKEEIELEEQRLKLNISNLDSIYVKIQQIKQQIENRDSRAIQENISNLGIELDEINAQKLKAESELLQQKAIENANIILIKKEQKIIDDLGHQLSILEDKIINARTVRDDAIFKMNILNANINTATKYENDILLEKVIQSDANVKKIEQIKLTEESKLRAETQEKIKNERIKHKENLEQISNTLLKNIETTKYEINVIEKNIEKIEKDILNIPEYTSNYLINSSNQYITLETQRKLEIEKLKLDILTTISEINVFNEKISESTNNLIKYREDNVNIQNELDKVVSNINNFKRIKANYQIVSQNIISPTLTFEDTNTKISINIESIMTNISNNITLTAYKNEYDAILKQKQKSKTVLLNSQDDVNYKKRTNKIRIETIHFILNLFIMTILLTLIGSNIQFQNLMLLVMTIFIIFFMIYVFNIIRIVNTKSENYYWQNPNFENMK